MFTCRLVRNPMLPLLALFAASLSVSAIQTGGVQANSESGGPKNDVERGRYLVHDMAQCVQCHTPRGSNGGLINDRLLQGAVIPLKSPFPKEVWAFESPWLAGLPSYDEDAVAYLLQHGRNRDGSRPRPPMPTYRMTESDARAVVAYLRSL